MMAPMEGARPTLGVAIVGAAVALVVALAGCSWRVETEPEPFRTPSPITVLRDQVAAAEAALATAAEADSGDLASAEAAAVPVRLEALGGVSPTSSPRPSTDLQAAVNEALAAAHQCIAGANDDPLGGTCAAIELSHWVIAVASGATAEDLPAPGAGLVPAVATSVDVATLSQLALEHDRLRALYEVIAARSSGAKRTDALARSSAERDRVAQLLAIAGVDDLTQPAYDVPAAATATKAARTATARAAELSLAQAYAALLIDAAADDRGWLENAAFTAYEGAIANGLTAAEVPALPGAVEPTPGAG
jgi:hypothetical protein